MSGLRYPTEGDAYAAAREAGRHDDMGWPSRWRGLERVCARAACSRGMNYEASTEFRIHGYCSTECESDAEYEAEIAGLRAALCRLADASEAAARTPIDSAIYPAVDNEYGEAIAEARRLTQESA